MLINVTGYSMNLESGFMLINVTGGSTWATFDEAKSRGLGGGQLELIISSIIKISSFI